MKPVGAVDLAYVRMQSADPAASARFLADIFGLQTVPARHDDIAFRSDDRSQSLTLAAAGESAVGMELGASADFDRIHSDLQRDGHAVREASTDECARRFVRRALIARDASGNTIDFVLQPYRSGRRFFATRDAGVTGLKCVGLRSLDVAHDLAFWRAIGNVEESDRVGEIAYLRIDSAHHRLALYPSRRKGLLYVTFAVQNLDFLMQNFYFLQEHQIKIVHGPGREAASGQAFLRFVGPDDQVYCFGCDMLEPDAARHRPRQFTFDKNALCSWGSECQGVPELQAPA